LMRETETVMERVEAVVPCLENQAEHHEICKGLQTTRQGVLDFISKIHEFGQNLYQAKTFFVQAEAFIANQISQVFENMVHTSILGHLSSGPPSLSTNLPSSLAPSQQHPALSEYAHSTTSSPAPSQQPPSEVSEHPPVTQIPTTNVSSSFSSSVGSLPSQQEAALHLVSSSFQPGAFIQNLVSSDEASSSPFSEPHPIPNLVITSEIPNTPMEIAEYLTGIPNIQDVPLPEDDIDIPLSEDINIDDSPAATSPDTFTVSSQIPTTPSEKIPESLTAASFQNIPDSRDGAPNDHFMISSEIPTTPSEIAEYLAAVSSFQDIPLPEDLDVNDMDDSDVASAASVAASVADQNISSSPLSLTSGLAQQSPTPSLYANSTQGFKRIRK